MAKNVEAMNNNKYKQTKRVLFVSIIMVALLFTLTACGGSAKTITGHWVADIETPEGYPAMMALFDDGTGKADAFDVTWYIKDNTLNLQLVYLWIQEDYTYEYKLSGDKLTLDTYTYTRQVYN